MSKKFLTGADLANQKIVNLADGSSATDAVTKQQLDAAVRGLDWKASVRAASTANVTLATPGTSLDGVTLASGDRILLMNQTTASQNGIYVWTGSAAALTRATDADASAEVTSGLAVTVTEGTVNGDKVYVLTTNDPIVLDTTSLAFSALGGSGSTYTNGNGLSLAGNSFSVNADGTSIIADGTSVRINSSYSGLAKRYAADVAAGSTTATVTHSLGSTDVLVAIYDKAAKTEVECDVVTTDSNTVTLTFAVAPTSGQYRVVIFA